MAGDGGLTSLFIAYAVVWGGLFAYLYYLWTVEDRLRDEVARLERRMDRRPATGDGEGGDDDDEE